MTSLWIGIYAGKPAEGILTALFLGVGTFFCTSYTWRELSLRAAIKKANRADLLTNSCEHSKNGYEWLEALMHRHGTELSATELVNLYYIWGCSLVRDALQHRVETGQLSRAELFDQAIKDDRPYRSIIETFSIWGNLFLRHYGTTATREELSLLAKSNRWCSHACTELTLRRHYQGEWTLGTDEKNALYEELRPDLVKANAAA